MLIWTPGGREFAEEWRDRPIGLEDAARRAVRDFEFRQAAARYRLWSQWMAQERFAAHMVPASSFIKVIGA
jgi:hypothetical protein